MGDTQQQISQLRA